MPESQCRVGILLGDEDGVVAPQVFDVPRQGPGVVDAVLAAVDDDVAEGEEGLLQGEDRVVGRSFQRLSVVIGGVIFVQLCDDMCEIDRTYTLHRIFIQKQQQVQRMPPCNPHPRMNSPEHVEELVPHVVAVRQTGDLVHVKGGDDLDAVLEQQGYQHPLRVGPKRLDRRALAPGEGAGEHGGCGMNGLTGERVNKQRCYVDQSCANKWRINRMENYYY